MQISFNSLFIFLSFQKNKTKLLIILTQTIPKMTFHDWDILSSLLFMILQQQQEE